MCDLGMWLDTEYGVNGSSSVSEYYHDYAKFDVYVPHILFEHPR